MTDQIRPPLVDTPVGDDEITISQAAARLGLSRQAILRSVHAGTLPAVRRVYPLQPQPVLFVRVADVDATRERPLVAGRKAKPGPQPGAKRRRRGQVR